VITEPSLSPQGSGPKQSADSDGLLPLHELVPLVYDELHDLAHWQLVRETRNGTLQTTALVHEVYLRLVKDGRVTALGRDYFFAAAARAMRQILVDAARRRGALKRGGGIPPAVCVDADDASLDSFASELLDLDRALAELGLQNPRRMQVVECRFFAGMSVDETAAALGVSPRTIKAEWALARIWLRRGLGSGGETE
jgi:RNA polymerase sigma factor (TIGR02999 family)